ncbi:Ribosome biogenesis protein NOP53 [Abortiporus biennis]
MTTSKTSAIKSSTTEKAKTKKTKSSVGAPSQRSQSSRKGKKAWRKNVDLDDVEEVLEELRTEERVTGSTVHSKTNDQLFQVDTTGDKEVRKRLPKFSVTSLTSYKILQERSAVPAILSRNTTTVKHARLTREEKDKLLRIGKKMRKGPFNGVIDPTEVGAGSALLEVSEAVKNSGGYDVWGSPADEEEQVDDGESFVAKKKKVKAPKTPHVRKTITLAAVPRPHEGTSYNPPVTSHQDLLLAAHTIEEKRVKDVEELEAVKRKNEEARRVAFEESSMSSGAPGMKVQEVNDEDDNEDEELTLTKKMPERKTKSERKKAEKRKAEKRALAEKLAQKRLLSSITAAKSLRKLAVRTSNTREQQRLAEQKQLEAKLKDGGLAGQKLGKHVVSEGEIDVQLGEELSESLRALKPEGNLFKDRFLNMQHRALVEPRVPVLPKKRKLKVKEYEKHAFKKFDREYNS